MKTIPLLFALLCSIHYSIGQWTPDTHVNTLVVDSAGSDLDAVSLSDGSTAVVLGISFGTGSLRITSSSTGCRWTPTIGQRWSFD